MKEILKYRLEIMDKQSISMPGGAKVLSAQMQRGFLQVWALCESRDATTADREFLVIGTGNPCPAEIECAAFIGTVQQHDGALVWHVFEVQP